MNIDKDKDIDKDYIDKDIGKESYIDKDIDKDFGFDKDISKEGWFDNSIDEYSKEKQFYSGDVLGSKGEKTLKDTNP